MAVSNQAKGVLLLVAGASLGAGAMKLFDRAPSQPKPAPQQSVSLPAGFQKQLDDFLREAARMESLASIGTTGHSFSEQLATTYAAFLLAQHSWPATFETDALAAFQNGISGWKLTARLWNGKHYGSDPISYDEPLNKELIRYGGSKVVHWRDKGNSDLEVLRVNDTLSLIMGIATAQSRRGREILTAVRR